MSDADGPIVNDRKLRKQKYRAKLEKCMETFNNILIINVDFVGSNQMQQVRIALRGEAEIIMGKNTIMRKVIRDNLEKMPKLEVLLPYLVGNIGFVFTNGNLNEMRKKITENKVPAGAKTGVIAPSDVYIPPGPTGLDPGQTQFFQALNIGTKISKGTIEIISQVHLVEVGKKVTASAVALLNKLGLRPFFYGITVGTVYEDGAIYDAKVLDLTSAALIGKFFNAANRVAAISFELGLVNACTIAHSFNKAFGQMLAICLETDYSFTESKEFFESNTGGGGGGGGGDAPAAAAAPVAAVVEEEEEEDGSAAATLFGGDEEEGGDY